MFSTGEESVRREGLFGSLYFETKQVRQGVTGASMGVANPTGLIIMFMIFCLFLALTQITFGGLKKRRAHLMEERASI